MVRLDLMVPPLQATHPAWTDTHTAIVGVMLIISGLLLPVRSAAKRRALRRENERVDRRNQRERYFVRKWETRAAPFLVDPYLEDLVEQMRDGVYAMVLAVEQDPRALVPGEEDEEDPLSVVAAMEQQGYAYLAQRYGCSLDEPGWDTWQTNRRDWRRFCESVRLYLETAWMEEWTWRYPETPFPQKSWAMLGRTQKMKMIIS